MWTEFVQCMFVLLSLHVSLFECNLFMWKATRINYNFIMDFSPSTALRYRDCFLISTSFMTMLVVSMVIHLILRSKGFSPTRLAPFPWSSSWEIVLNSNHQRTAYILTGPRS